jgi:hypothetical protein
MRFSCLLLLVCVGFVSAQTNADPDVLRAQAEIENLKALVDAGAAPRAQLEKARDTMADAQDAAFLRRTAYGQELTVEQADEMIAAATRRFERRKEAFDHAKTLVDAGAAAGISLNSLLQDLELARKECDLVETRARLTRELADMARAEEALQTRLSEQAPDASQIADRFDGDGIFTGAIFSKIETAFEVRFGKPLPVSAMGETAVHRALGFDHTGRVDVAVHPDQPEGVWLRQYLVEHKIPFFAFRQAVPGKATGAHIHLGPISTHLASGG